MMLNKFTPFFVFVVVVVACFGVFAEANSVTATGYAMDNLCIDLGYNLDVNEVVTMEAPEDHSIHCLIDVPRCYLSGFAILAPPADTGGLYTVAYQLDDAGVQLVIVAAEQARTDGMDTGFSVTVSGWDDGRGNLSCVQVEKDGTKAAAVDCNCSGSDCGGHGLCSDSGTCFCDTGYSGLDCETSLCSGVDCQNDGICSVMDGTCTCLDPYHGNYCQNNATTTFCTDVICSDGGSCDPAGLTGTCDCVDGWAGPQCMTEKMVPTNAPTDAPTDAPYDYWAQYGDEKSRCDYELGALLSVENQTVCQAEAVSEGAPWYSYDSDGKFCMVSSTCDVFIATSDQWRIFYGGPEMQVLVEAAAHTSIPSGLLLTLLSVFAALALRV